MANEIDDYPTLQCNLEEHKQLWLEKMRKCQSDDIELGHVHADEILCDLVKKYCPFGNEIVEIYDGLYKWYA